MQATGTGDIHACLLCGIGKNDINCDNCRSTKDRHSGNSHSKYSGPKWPLHDPEFNEQYFISGRLCSNISKFTNTVFACINR